MATFTSGYQIKLIADGGESGTWGQSTNENLERIEQALGESVLINVEFGSENSTWDVGTHTLTWLTNNSGDAADPNGNGKGRARYVEFISTDQFNTPVTVKIRGNTDLIYPDRVYLVKNSINTDAPPANALSDLILDVGANGNYTVRPGAFALVVANASTAITGTDRDAGSVFNALSDLQIENLIFGNAADITLRDDLAAALEIKSTIANTEFLRFDTLNNHLEIAPGSAVNNIELRSNTITTSAQATALQINTSNVAALDIKSNASSLLKFDTSVTGDMIVVGAENIDATSTSKDLDLKDAETSALSILHGGTEFVRLNTNVGSNTGVNTVQLLADQCDLEIQSDNTLVVNSGAVLDVNGLSQLSIVDIDGGSVDAGNIRNTSIGALIGGGASTVRGARFTQDPSYYGSTNGYTFGDGTVPAGLFMPSAGSVVKLKQSDAKGLGFVRTSVMDSATDGSTGYFIGDWTMPTGAVPVGQLREGRWQVSFNHGFASTPKTVNWYWERVTAPSPLESYDYPVGSIVSAHSGGSMANAEYIGSLPPLLAFYKDSSEITLNMLMNQQVSTTLEQHVWRIPLNDPNPSGSYPLSIIINSGNSQDYLESRDWKLVVEAWE